MNGSTCQSEDNGRRREFIHLLVLSFKFVAVICKLVELVIDWFNIPVVRQPEAVSDLHRPFGSKTFQTGFGL